tara:strand:+ start:65 stop:280 length:216 start_codon:yes stop_codon:yes gene_type:complete
MTTYYTLAVYDTDLKKWYVEFVANSKTIVSEERQSLIESYLNTKPKHTKIIKTGGNQQSIDAAIAKLNGSK